MGMQFTYRDLQHQPLTVVVGLQGVQNGRELVRIELDCNLSLAAIQSQLNPLARASRWMVVTMVEKQEFASIASDRKMPSRGLTGVCVQMVHTVDDGTNDLVNLADEVRAGLRAGEPSRKGRQDIGAERLERATGHRGWSGEGSPPEGPGEAAGAKRTGQLAGKASNQVN